MRDPQPHDKVVALKVLVSASLSLAIMLVDFVWLIRDEIKLVWPRLRGSWQARGYMLARYIGILSQIFNIYFAVRMYIGIYTSPVGCRFWFTYQAVIVQLLLCFVEGLLMLRLWYLFLRSRYILVILGMFACCQFASMVVSARLSFPSNKYTVTCMMVKGNPGNAFFSATTLTTNLIIFFMTFWRYFRLPAKWTREGIGRIVIRDSALSLGAITVMMLFLMLCSLQVIKPTMSGNITYYWLVCILWVSIGRIIVNHEKIPQNEGEQSEGSTWKGTLQLTSQIEMGESTLSVDTQCGSSDGRTPTSRTLQSSLSTPVTKASQLSPSSGRPNDKRWFGEPPSSDDAQDTLQLSSTEVSICRLSPSNVSPSDPDSQQMEDCPQADGDEDERVHEPVPSPRSSSSEPLPSPQADGDEDERMHEPVPSPRSSSSEPLPSPQADGDEDERVHEPVPSPQSSSSEPLPSGVSS